MSWIDLTIDRLADAPHWSYRDGYQPAAEPTSLAALALYAHGRESDAQRAVDWLTRVQSPGGSVGVTAKEKSPCWPTAWAILAWHVCAATTGSLRYRGCIDRAVGWALKSRGATSKQSPLVGHDTTLIGWPWVLGTHSWLEPTALFVIALKCVGRHDHPRTREAVRMLTDRLLPSGGCNYGNTIVMGQELLPHVQSTGLVLLALSHEEVVDDRLELSLDYLVRSSTTTTAAASLAYGLLGLTAHNRRPADADVQLARVGARPRVLEHSGYVDALVALAALDDETNPLLGCARSGFPRAKANDMATPPHVPSIT